MSSFRATVDATAAHPSRLSTRPVAKNSRISLRAKLWIATAAEYTAIGYNVGPAEKFGDRLLRKRAARAKAGRTAPSHGYPGSQRSGHPTPRLPRLSASTEESTKRKGEPPRNGNEFEQTSTASRPRINVLIFEGLALIDAFLTRWYPSSSQRDDASTRLDGERDALQTSRPDSRASVQVPTANNPC